MLHDIVWEYVQKELSGDAFKAAQRRLVERFRRADRDETTPVGKYMHRYIILFHFSSPLLLT
jgi:hypothetical protein